MLYKLIVDFIIPVYRSTKKIKEQFGDIQSKMQEDMTDYQQRKNSPPPEAPQKEGDYIEFEEVKK